MNGRRLAREVGLSRDPFPMGTAGPLAMGPDSPPSVGIGSPNGENSCNCPGDCGTDPCCTATCGDNQCSCGEYTCSCPQDCGFDPCCSNYCGDNSCDFGCGEDCFTCYYDCPFC